MLLAAALGPAVARAGACCVGSTSGAPTVVGECERWLAGLGLSGEATVGRWDGAGRVAPSSLDEAAVAATAVVAWRWDRRGQLSVQVPVRASAKAAGDLHGWGGGIGDLVIATRLDPFEERYAPPGDFGRPAPVLTLGLRAPTGRTWMASEAPLLADVTGLPGLGVMAGVSLERTLGLWPWSVGADAIVPIAGQGTPAALGASAALGRYVGTRWSVLGTARYSFTASDGHGAARTRLGARVVRGERAAWRGWLGVEGDVPVAGLGRAQQQTVSVASGVAVVR